MMNRTGRRRGSKIDARIICATNRSLPALVREGLFRKDLLFRLDVLRIHTPPLRSRSDKPFLIKVVLQKLCSQHGLSYCEFDVRQNRQLLKYGWPGNVRELEGALLRFLIEGRLDLSGEPERSNNDDNANLKQQLRKEKSRII